MIEDKLEDINETLINILEELRKLNNKNTEVKE